MKISGRRITLAVVLVIFSALMITSHSCMTFRMSPQEIDTFLTRRNVDYRQDKYTTGFRDIHYVEAGSQVKPLILFVHGSPGSLSAFIHFLADTALLDRALLITADRPGFGYSNFGNAEPSLQKQGKALKPLLEKYKNNRPILLVGHSLGGPLIARMAIDYPDMVDGLVIVAGSVDPKLEPNETWFRAPLATPFLSWILPRSWRASNEEIYQLKPELEDLVPRWKEITCPVVVIQGEKDSLVPKENVAFIKKMLLNAPVDFMVVENMDHFVPWSNPELIRDALIKLLDNEFIAGH